MDPLLQHLAAWRPFSALVVGDFMLDQLQTGDADRLSADAPVPVLHVKKTENRAGGAANVALDLAAMHATVRVAGVVGADPEAALLRAALESHGVDARDLVADPSRPTTVKRSLVGLAQGRHPQKMFRVDYESRETISREIEDRLLAAVDRALAAGVDVVCLEDYAKGVCTERVCQGVIDRCRAADREVFIDPARLNDYAKYRGATAITPNRTEAELATGMRTHDHADAAHNARLAHGLMAQLDLDAVVLTLDKHGALLLERGTDPVAIPTVAREVYDVTGAGDMMLAALAAARANALPWDRAVRFANAAAGLEVEQFGVVPIPLERIIASVHEQVRGRLGKHRTLDELAIEVAALRRAGRRVAFTNGCFDVLHPGHFAMLQEARAQGDYLIVATNTDERIREYKGPNRPVNDLRSRVMMLSGLACVDAVLVFEEDTPLRAIEAIRPDVLVKGAEYDESRIPGAALVKSYGGRVHRAPMRDDASTTRTLERLGDPRAVVVKDAAREARFVKDQ